MSAIWTFIVDLFSARPEDIITEQRALLKKHHRQVASEARRAERQYDNEIMTMRNHLFDGNRLRAQLSSESAALHYANWMQLRRIVETVTRVLNRLTLVQVSSHMSASTMEVARALSRINGRLSTGDYARVMMQMSRDVEVFNMRVSTGNEAIMEVGDDDNEHTVAAEDGLETGDLARKLLEDAETEQLADAMPSVSHLNHTGAQGAHDTNGTVATRRC